MNISEYIADFNEKDVINVFSEIVKADAPSISFIDRDVDILDVEMFFDEHCVAIGLEEEQEGPWLFLNRRKKDYIQHHLTS